MHVLNFQPRLVGRPSRSPLVPKAVVAPSRQQQSTAKKAPSVNAKVSYVKPEPDGNELFIYLYEKPEGVDRVTNLEHIECEVPFTDLRTVESQSGEFTLRQNGFQLERLEVPSDIDWQNEQDVSMVAPDNALACFQCIGSMNKATVLPLTCQCVAGCCQILPQGGRAAEAHSWCQ